MDMIRTISDLHKWVAENDLVGKRKIFFLLGVLLKETNKCTANQLDVMQILGKLANHKFGPCELFEYLYETIDRTQGYVATDVRDLCIHYIGLKSGVDYRIEKTKILQAIILGYSNCDIGRKAMTDGGKGK